MTFADLAAGTSLFVDANVFVYHAVSHATRGPACRQLMERIARQEVSASTSADVLSDVAHRVMTLEATVSFGWPLAGIASRLKQKPNAIQQRSRFRQAIEEIVQFGVRLLPTEGPLVLAAASLSQQHGLLSGDALIVALMQHHGLTHLASNDPDFDRVPGLTRYARPDLPDGPIGRRWRRGISGRSIPHSTS